MPPPVTYKANSGHITVIHQSTEEKAERQMKEAVHRARVANGEGDDESVVDLSVSFDGTWAKRGYTSNIGVGVIISIDMREVLDREVLSKYCDDCYTNYCLKRGEGEYQKWWEGRQLSKLLFWI